MANIGFIGLGIMGTPMARHLQDAGHTIITSKFAIAPRQELLDNGLKIVDSPKALAETVDTIILMLPDTPEVQDVLFGENGVSYGLSAGKLVIDMSSISPIETKEFAKKVRATGAEYVDGPVSGGEVGAKNATLSIMAAARGKALTALCRSSSSWARTSRSSAIAATAR
jgi:2-hydroxy-3-oxopropionate reductase